MTKHLVDQPTLKPTRKLRWQQYVLAALVVGVYGFGAIEGNEIVSREAALDALGVLLSGGTMWAAGWLVREEG